MLIALYVIFALTVSFFIMSFVCFIIAEHRGDTVNLAEQAQISGTKWEKYEKNIKEGIEWIEQAPSKDVYIRSRDGLRLHAKAIGQKSGAPIAILFHGYRSSAHNEFSCLAGFYSEMGFNVLLVDQRAHGQSEGKYIGFGALERYDCVLWANYASEHYDSPDIVLSGVSMGATTVLLASGLGLPENVKCIVADCGYTSPGDIIARVMKKEFRLAKFPMYYLASAYSRIIAGYSYGSCSTLEAVKQSAVPVLFFHGREDELVPCKMSEKAYRASAAEKKELCLVEGAHHAESYAKSAEEYKIRLRVFLQSAIK